MTDEIDLREVWRQRYKPILDTMFQDASGGFFLTPDQAMDLLEEVLPSLLSTGQPPEAKEDTPGMAPRFNFAAFRREAHHYAVDLFYKTYYEELRGKGRPPLPQEHLDQVLMLRRQGLSHAQIAIKLGQTREATRKQVKQLERLWAQKTREIYALAAKLNLIAPEPNPDSDP